MAEIYFNNKGKYSKEYNELIEKLVPRQGEAPTQIGLLLQCCRDLYLEYYDNDNVNLYENVGSPTQIYTCHVCDGSGVDEYGCPCPCCDGNGETYEYDRCISDKFQHRINFINLWSILVRNDKGKQLRDHVSKLHDQLLKDTYTTDSYLFYKDLYERLIDYVMELILDEKTDLENAIKMGLNNDPKREDILELEYEKLQLETKYSTLVTFLECAQNVCAQNGKLTPGVFYNQNELEAKFYISDLGEEAQELWRKFHDKLCEAVRDYKTALQQDISEIEDKIKELKK